MFWSVGSNSAFDDNSIAFLPFSNSITLFPYRIVSRIVPPIFSVHQRLTCFGIGVERIFPFHSPRVEKIEIVRRAKVRQAKLYYLRELRGKAARLKELKTARPKTKVKKVKTRGKKAKAAKAAAKKAWLSSLR